MEPLSQLTEDEFEHIEEEIARTAKGRSFLRRFRRQALGAATEEIRTMLEEFRLSWRQQTQAIEAVNRINVLRQELIEMAASIERARREVAALQPEDADNNKIITATSELDAIVISTERASFEILNAAERLMELSSRFREGGADPELCSILDSEVTSIFTACSFQDLTGQRTSKVVNALRYIEQRINAVISIWGASSDTAPIPDDHVDTREDAHLLCGPQMEGRGVSQNDVDAMFDSPAPAPAVSPDAAAALEAVSKLLQAHQAGLEADRADEPPAAPAARFSQSDIDALLSGDEPPAPPPPPPAKAAPKSSQSDVDALFDAPAPPPKAAPKGKQDQADIDALFDAPAPAKAAPKGKQDQSDIDALFDAPAPPKAASKGKQDQADIDALFDAPAPPKPAPAPAKPPPPAAKPAPPPPPPQAKPKPKAPEPAAPASPLDQSAIDALFG